ncbi:Ent-kaur-16-ene synthase [Ampelomyces quisqualis]|uniref:Ent-kaur-16-ene synthase n=1 Tax=Ampelomyces quisqualis TaxID=50730 RepID=A0A6A5R5N3_AMPQU|nr:Ent-kaur-16-ene synthase [Ampelomyces quisqualis]
MSTHRAICGRILPQYSATRQSSSNLSECSHFNHRFIMTIQLDDLAAMARLLIQRTHNAFHPKYGFSTTSCQIYDTAWAAMIQKEINGNMSWLFPQSFCYLLDSQAEDGSWGVHPKSKTVGVLDTAAATLALLRHAKTPLQLQDIAPSELAQRIKKGLKSLQMQLVAWDDLLDTNHIGVELIVPALLGYLTAEDMTLQFTFESESILEQIHAAKMARFKPESLYQERPSSALHHLEALIGKIDFDKVEHHLFNGSMLASPSSTAAFLMHASSWNIEAEAYLQHVFVAGTGRGRGGFPGTYPTTYFELNWVLSTLLQAGFTLPDLNSNEMLGVREIISEGFVVDNGIIGFAPHAVDVDDTAKGILTLSLLGLEERVTPTPMILMFEAEDHFRTFMGERDPSFTSNCHVLLALLHRSDIDQYLPQIEKTAKFLCKVWWDSDGLIKDKWHLSHLYPTMLLVQSFGNLIQQISGSGRLRAIFDSEMLSRLSVCLFQACLRTLLDQMDDGSWDGKPEESSYATLALVEAGRLVLFQALKPQIATSISKAKAFLESEKWTTIDQNWTSKTTYQTIFVAEGYLLAALKASSMFQQDDLSARGLDRGQAPPSNRETDFLQLVSKTELFSSTASWELQASFLESALFIPILRANRSKVFDRDRIDVSKDHYIDIIPFTWVSCNNRSRRYVATSILFDMMVISMLGYQVDEFIEAVASPAFSHKTEELHDLVNDVLDQAIAALEPVKAGQVDSKRWTVAARRFCNEHASSDTTTTAMGNPVVPDTSEYGTVEETLRRFAQYVLEHPHVHEASLEDQLCLWRELRAFLHAHVVQISDNARFLGHSGRTFFDWVRTTAADHVACAYSFAFACCLVSGSIGGGAVVFGTAAEAYLVQAAARHMATMCRMCNDIGSVERDVAEGNTNSIDFPEFSHDSAVTGRKRTLSGLAAYERSCLMHTLDRLSQEALLSPKVPQTAHNFRQRKIEVVRFFAEVTDFYDQLYMLRDLSSTLN